MDDTFSVFILKEPGGWRAIALAVLIHALLLTFLWFGVSWKNDRPISVDAEIWSTQADAAVPVAPSQLAAIAVVEQPQVASKEASAGESDIAIGLEKKKVVARPSEGDEEKKQLREAVPVANPQLVSIPVMGQSQIEIKEASIEKSVIATENNVVTRQAEDEVEKKLADDRNGEQITGTQLSQHVEDLKGITIDPGAIAENAMVPKLAKNPVDSDWMDRVKAKIISNITYTVPSADREDDSQVAFAVKLLPDGSVARIQKVTISRNPAFDEAVRSAIEKSQPYPVDDSGKVPSSFDSVTHPYEIGFSRG